MHCKDLGQWLCLGLEAAAHTPVSSPPGPRASIPVDCWMDDVTFALGQGAWKESAHQLCSCSQISWTLSSAPIADNRLAVPSALGPDLTLLQDL